MRQLLSVFLRCIILLLLLLAGSLFQLAFIWKLEESSGTAFVGKLYISFMLKFMSTCYYSKKRYNTLVSAKFVCSMLPNLMDKSYVSSCY